MNSQNRFSAHAKNPASRSPRFPRHPTLPTLLIPIPEQTVLPMYLPGNYSYFPHLVTRNEDNDDNDD